MLVNIDKYRILILVLFLPVLLGCKNNKASQDSELKEILWTASWSPDGKYIAIGGNQDTLRIFSGSNFKLIKNYPLKNTITKLKWHPNENLLAIATQISTEKISVLDFSEETFIYLDSISKDGARGIDWNYTGDLLAVGDNDGQLTIFTKNGEFIRQIKSEQKSITDLSWHPFKNILVTVGRQIEMYDYTKDTSLSIKPRPYDVLMLCVEWHKSGDFFVTGDYGDYDKNYPALLQFWDEGGEKIKETQESKAEYRNLRWDMDGKNLATASDALRIWSVDGELIGMGKSKALLWGVDWSNDQQKLVTSSENGEIVIWNNEPNPIKKIKY